MKIKLKITLLLVFQISLFSAQLSTELKKAIETIDYQYFQIMLKSYNMEKYSKLYEMYGKASEIATNDELFYLAFNGSTFVRINSVDDLILRKDKRIIQLYEYYSEFPLEYETRIGQVISHQDMAFSNIRASVISQLKNYKWYLEMKNNIKNQKLRDFYSQEQIKYYENFDSKTIEDLISEFDKIDKKFISLRLDSYKEIIKNWKGDKLTINYD